MDLPIEDIHLIDLLEDTSFHLSPLKRLFGENMDLDWINCIKIDASNDCHWVWTSPKYKISISATVYEHINMNRNIDDSWLGWNLIWKLSIILRIKNFIWKMAHGKLTTGALLYSLNIGPFSLSFWWFGGGNFCI